MKKIFVLITILAAAISCSKEQEAQLTPLTFTAVGEQTKTSLDGQSIVWSTSDHVMVFASADYDTPYNFAVTSTENSGRKATIEGLGTVSPEYYVLFPYQADAAFNGAEMTLTIPTDQAAVAGSFGPSANPAIAYIAGTEDLLFKNVGALLAVNIQASDVTGLKVESLDGTEMTGLAQFDCAGSEPVLNDFVGGQGKAYVQTTVSGAGVYYLVVAPGSYTGGFRLTFTKSGYKAVVENTKALTVARNDNVNLFATPTDIPWQVNFTPGEEITIKGSTEDGQKLAYVGTSGYWNSSIQYSDVDSYSYNYEIFTRLTQDQKFYFETVGGDNYTLNAAGTAVEPLADIANAPYGAPSDGIYRIRMNFPNGAAEVKRITDVTYDIYGLDSRALTYVGGGVWSSDNFLMRTNSYMNRYRFLMNFADNSKQYYGRMDSATGQPIYGVTGADYFYVQPTVDNDADHWSPCFKYQWETSAERYYCTMTLSLNNDNGHYTHSLTNLTDTQIPQGIVSICGSSEAGQQMGYITSDHYNSAMADYGDNPNLIPTAISEYFEIFTRLEAGEKFYFYNASTGKYYAPNANGDCVQEIANPSEATYSISTGGAWRIRANFSTGAAIIRRIDQVRTELNYDGDFSDGVHVLSYSGKGTWKKDNAVIKGHPGQYGRTLFTEYVIKIWFNRDNADNTIDLWQVYGSTSVKSGSPDPSDDGSYWNVQPATGDNWTHVFFFPSWTVDASNNGRYTATITLYMNDAFNHYTHRFTNVVDNI